MSDTKKISTLEADKQRLLDALRQLRKEGVTLIDDRVGRPAVISGRPRAELVGAGPVSPKAVESLLLDDLDRLFIEDTDNANDPYNKRLK